MRSPRHTEHRQRNSWNNLLWELQRIVDRPEGFLVYVSILHEELIFFDSIRHFPEVRAKRRSSESVGNAPHGKNQESLIMSRILLDFVDLQSEGKCAHSLPFHRILDLPWLGALATHEGVAATCNSRRVESRLAVTI